VYHVSNILKEYDDVIRQTLKVIINVDLSDIIWKQCWRLLDHVLYIAADQCCIVLFMSYLSKFVI